MTIEGDMNDTVERSVARPSAMIAELRRRIADGSWPIGSRIPVEAELAAQFDVSRNALREAVQALVHVGLLETRQGVGTFVRATHEIDQVLTSYLREEDLRPILETRRALEAEAAALAALRADPESLDEIQRACDTADRDGDDYSECALRFHLAVVTAARNPVLARLYTGLMDSLRFSVRTPPGTAAAAHILLSGHRELLEAIRSHDAVAARQLALDHIDQALQILDGGCLDAG